MLLFVDNLTNVDFSFLDPQRGLLGETWLANVRLHGELDEQGMVCDFGTVKKVIRHWLDTELDHRLAVPTRSPQIRIEEDGDFLSIHWHFGSQGEFLHTRSPRDAIALVDAEVLTEESVAQWCISQLKQHFPMSVARLELDFTLETINGAYYHYSHGLKKHRGNCQRIAHGHRSRIDIWANGKKSPKLEQQWADEWRDIYLGTREDLLAKPHHQGVDYYHFAYNAEQGPFEITLPQRCCYLLDTDTTVEFIAHHIAQKTRQENPESFVRVKAYEGINKGAIAEA
uniref:6-carboxytetrahydropterin synthase n=1 Tax=Cellvibrio fontiphilus TaxID=1815559 RepID=UPI002B4BCB4B|nr:6-carboxytetrahydropterin synthase [Cellvibrio fontiphilus]